MKYFIWIVLSISLIACTNTVTPTQTVAPRVTETITPGTITATASPTQIPLTKVSNVIAFPDVNEYEWQLLTRGLTRPLDIQSPPDGSGRLFIVEKPGTIKIYEAGQLLDTPFLNITSRVNDSDREQGLLGLAFHPEYQQNGYFYVNYINFAGDTIISRFQAEGDYADRASEKILLTIDQPYSNHNGGALAFGKDGYLYLGMGDGGGRGDPFNNAQNTNSLLGKILRIDVNHGEPYSIPPSNPFGNEVWAYGLRNPWRISFDANTNDLWIGDVGQDVWEEINFLRSDTFGGVNFGWNIMEGKHGYRGNPDLNLRWPAVEYSHEYGCSVTGGYVYRGTMPEWDGIYLYGDYCTGSIWGLILVNQQWQNQLLFQTNMIITSFGQDETGEIYLASDNGSIYLLKEK